MGSILEPVLLNILINDICYFISDSSLYNYADDNTLSYSGYDLDKIINTLEKDSLNLFKYFHILFNTLSFLEAFLQIFVMWDLNFNS
jgi:hypothetical protein